MSEERIFDGVNVAECKFRHISNMNNWLCTSNEFNLDKESYCDNSKDCFFKQLQRLKQENEKLKCRIEGLEKCEDIFFQENEDNKKFRQALEEIREITKKYDAKAGNTIIANPIQDCYDIFVKAKETLND